MTVLTAELNNGVKKFENFDEAYNFHDGGVRIRLDAETFYLILSNPQTFEMYDWVYIEYEKDDKAGGLDELLERIEAEYGIK